jgi:phosphoribosylformylglycinamidine synthase I
MKPRALILHANGINRDLEAAEALEKAGARAEIVHLNQLRRSARNWDDYQILCIPGGFSYADALGGGKLMALEMNVYFSDQVRAFVDSGKPVIGICNGFQALVKAGILPGGHTPARKKGARPDENRLPATLTFNESGRFECRWVYLKPSSRKCLWTRGLKELVYCPVAHGEGRFLTGDLQTLKTLVREDRVALVYAFPDGTPAGGMYPDNPNGSPGDVAGVCNEQGNVLGLMPHPEDHIHDWQHPRNARGESGMLGLRLYETGVRYAAGM